MSAASPAAANDLDRNYDLLWLLLFALVLIASGIGLRDPWPADEPRFALIARDMVASGHWLIPSVGNDWYPDKPPLYFWMISAGLTITGSLRIAFLLPSLLAGLGCLVLVYDLARRLWDRDVARTAGWMLLVTVQFIWQMRQAQIDATLCFWTTLGLYGLLRHLLLGPQWRWYVIGWAAAGFGVITKGVGFLPLLIFIPWLLSRWGHWSPRPSIDGGARWLLGPVALLAAICVWFVPMLIATSGDPALLAYRNEILFQQTVHRYADAWHHRAPFWYFIVEVIPALWLPLTALLPWTIPRWRDSLRERDARILLLLSWVGLVVLFFSLSTGKRGVYVVPAIPALVLASSPVLAQVFQRKGPQRVLFALAAVLAALALAGAGYLALSPSTRAETVADWLIDPTPALATIGFAVAVILAVARPRRGLWAWSGSLAVTLMIMGFWISPALNTERSWQAFVTAAQAASHDVKELGLVGYKEQFLLYFERPTFNFGHARWRDAEQETADGASWLNAHTDRGLLIEKDQMTKCFPEAQSRSVGPEGGGDWYVVTGKVNPTCVAAGHLSAARLYHPP
jgi:4-amino-4-deoxy-L-arabinose transferase-like glycosyltransferase